MLYRPIRGSLRRAMEEVKEITTWNELIELIDALYYEHPLHIDADYQGVDNRIGWESYLLGAKMPGRDHTSAAGYLNDNPNKLIGCPTIEVKSAIPGLLIVPKIK